MASGLAKALRWIGLGLVEVQTGECVLKTFKFEISGKVEVTGPVTFVSSELDTVTVCVGRLRVACRVPFTISVEGVNAVHRGTGHVCAAGEFCRFRLAFVGESGVGKTPLVRAMCGDPDWVVGGRYAGATAGHTGGAEYRAWTFGAGPEGRADIWDTGGGLLHSMARFYLRQADMVIACYDVSNRRSFDSIPEWAALIREVAPQAAIILVGCACDRDREVSTEEADAARAALRLNFASETSAKTGVGVEAFRKMVRHFAGRAGLK